MSEFNSMIPQGPHQTPIVRTESVSAPAEQAPEQATAQKAAPNRAAFERVLQRQPVVQNLLEPELLEAPLNRVSSQKLRQQAARVPRPQGMMLADSPLTRLGDRKLVETLMKGENGEGVPRFGNINRSGKAIEASGLLGALQLLADRQIEVPASEFNRSTADDAVLVMTGFARMSPAEIEAKKQAAYEHPEVKTELEGAIAKKFYGSEKHKEFGALVEALTGGVLSAEEAMAMYPCGGIPGPGADEVPVINGLGAIQRHAMRHDALGFLLTRFEVGPGYGSKTTVFGRQNTDPLAGQLLGVARELFKDSSVSPESGHVAGPERFRA